jgi:phosphate transport system permease protein
MSLRKRRGVMDKVFAICCFLATFVGVVLLIVLLWSVFKDGFHRLNLDFLRKFPSYVASRSGILSPIVGSLIVMLLTAAISVPIGVGAAIYLEEFNKRNNRWTQFVQLNISNLAGVPSIVYGLLGLVVFVRWCMLDRSVISGALTMSLLVLPMVIIVSQEALRAVPSSLREASLALGATQWQTIRHHVLPNAAPGILTGIILALSRAIGETAPLIVVGAVGMANFLPKSLKDGFVVLPLQVYQWSSRPEKAFHENAAAAIVVLLVTLVFLNSIAIFLRQKYSKKQA